MLGALYELDVVETFNKSEQPLLPNLEPELALESNVLSLCPST